MRFTLTARFITLAMLISSACGDDTTTNTSKPDAATHSLPDAGLDAGHDAGKQTSPATAVCPVDDPSADGTCSEALRCQLKRHGDCLAPSCPPGCKYLGIIPGAKVTSGVVFFATCQDGQWVQSSQGDCSENKNAAMCECPDHDAGQ